MRSGLQQRRRLLKGGPLHLDCKAAAAEQMPKEVHVRLADQYDILEKLGQGSAGVLHHAKRRADGKEVALKTIPKIDPEFTAFTQKEYNVLRSIKHPHIIQAFDFFETEEQIVLVLELFGGQSLEDTVHCASRRCLDEGVTKGLFKMLLQAIDHLHQHRIVHRDVKAANILVSHDLADLRLVDFNTAQQLMEGGALTMTGTLQYAAPEVLLGDSPSESNDVWSAGLCLYFMLSGRLPQRQDKFATLAEFANAVATRPVSLQSKQWSRVTEPCKLFLRSCLEINKAFRPAPMILLEHEWFRSRPIITVAQPLSLKRSASLPSQILPTSNADILKIVSAAPMQSNEPQPCKQAK